MTRKNEQIGLRVTSEDLDELIEGATGEKKFGIQTSKTRLLLQR
jgi:hypothetical protein